MILFLPTIARVPYTVPLTMTETSDSVWPGVAITSTLSDIL